MSIPLYAIGEYIHRSSELKSCVKAKNEQVMYTILSFYVQNSLVLVYLIWYLNLKLQELDVLHGLLQHRADVDLRSVRDEGLQDFQPLIDPLSSFLQGEIVFLLISYSLDSANYSEYESIYYMNIPLHRGSEDQLLNPYSHVLNS